MLVTEPPAHWTNQHVSSRRTKQKYIYTHAHYCSINTTHSRAPPAPRSLQGADGGNMEQRGGTPLQEADLQKVVAVVVRTIAVAIVVEDLKLTDQPGKGCRGTKIYPIAMHPMSTKKTERETKRCLPLPFLEFTFTVLLLPFIY